MNGLTFAFTLGIIIMLFLHWWTFHTHSGRKWLNGDDEDKK